MTRQSTILVGLLSIVAWFMKFGHFVSAQDVATSPGQDQPIGCTLQCQNNSTCISGEADFSMFPRPNGEVMNFLEETNRQGFHCLCPDSFAGILCNRQYEVCENQNHVCYHGGKCLNQGDQITQVCDCSSASFQGRQYQGPFCEQAVTTSVEICDNSRRTFCLNGKCNDEFSLTPNKNLCKCDEGFYGEHCELSVDHYKPDCSGSTCEVGDGALDGNRKAENKNSGEEDCSLDCKHGGVCTKANKYLDDLTGNHNLDFLSAFNDQNFEHCVCAEGWTGSLCTTKIEVCGNDKHICLHGSRCMEHEDGGYWCDCSEAFTVESRFAGDFCQHHHTEVCTATGQLQFTGGLADHEFCVNDGICVTSSEGHQGCACKPSYYGPHCEFYAADPIENISDGTQSPTHAGIIVYLLFLFLVLSAFVLVGYRIRQKNNESAICRDLMDQELSFSPDDNNRGEPSQQQASSDLDDVELL